jgi:replicative DNA helicase
MEPTRIVTLGQVAGIRPLPSAPELEVAVLGALLLEHSAWNRTADSLSPEVFGEERHRQIYRIGREIWAKGEMVDAIAIVTRLRLDGLLESVGGPAYVADLTTNVATASNIEYHARILVEHTIARKLIGIGQDCVNSAYASPDALSLLDRIAADIRGLYRYTEGSTMITGADDLHELTDTDRAKASLSWGITDLDALCRPEPGLPHVFAGRPGIGKSIFCVEVCWHWTLSGDVLLFSPEMTPRQVRARIIARETGVPYRNILRPDTMHDQQRAKVYRATVEHAERLRRLKIDPTGGITPEQIRVRTEMAMQKGGVVAFAVDHLHKMKTGDKRTDRSDFDRISQSMNGVTEVAKNTMLPGLIMCQLNREVEKRSDKRPNMADLRGSGEIEQDAAVIGLLYREGYYQPEPPYEDDLEVSIAKNRDGATGVARAKMVPAISRIGGSAFTDQYNNTPSHEKAPF